MTRLSPKRWRDLDTGESRRNEDRLRLEAVQDGRPLPPSQPQGWVDPDPLYVEPEPVRRAYQGWELEPKPMPIPWAFVVVAFCAGVLAGALLLTFARAVDAAPRAAANDIPTHVLSAGALAGNAVSDSEAVEAGRGGRATRLTAGAPSPTGEVGTALLGGYATWYDDGPGFYAAAGPQLRRAIGAGWRHSLVEVHGPAHASIVVELVDSCACGARDGIPTFLDLSPAAFRELAPLSAGIVAVSIELATELPRTDADIRMMLEVRDDEVYR